MVMKLNFGPISKNMRHGFQSTESKVSKNDTHFGVTNSTSHFSSSESFMPSPKHLVSENKN